MERKEINGGKGIMGAGNSIKDSGRKMIALDEKKHHDFLKNKIKIKL